MSRAAVPFTGWMEDSPGPERGTPAARVWRFVICMLLGAACGLAGILPWFVYGARLTLQNLWATPTVNPADMPVVLLPFSQYELGLVAGTVVVGSAVAGVVARILAARGLRQARGGLLAGVLAVQLAALVQTATAVSGGLQHPRFLGPLIVNYSAVYVIVVSTWILVMMAVGGAAFILLTDAASSHLVIGVGVVAVFLEAWIRGVVAPPSGAALGPNDVGLFIAHWASAVVVGAVIARSGIVPVRKLLTAVSALAVLGAGEAAVTAMTWAAGTRVLWHLPGALVLSVESTFVWLLWNRSLALVAVAAGCALVGAGVRWAIFRRGSRGADGLSA